MKKNLSKNAVKSMAIGLAIAMGSSVAISGVSGNLVEATASESESKLSGITNPDFSQSNMVQNKYIFNGDLLFKVENVDNSSSTGKASFVGKVTASNQITGEADGTNKPFKAASLTKGVLSVNGKNDKNYSFTVENIGTGEPLKKYTVSTSSMTSSALDTISGTEVNSVLDKATTIKTKAFDNINITDTSESAKVVFPETLKTIETKAIGGVASSNQNNPVYFDLKAIKNLDGFQETGFDKDTATSERYVNIELANENEKKKFDTKFKTSSTPRAYITSTEKQAPTINSVSYDGNTTIKLTASENLEKSEDLLTFTVTKKETGEVKATSIEVTNAKIEQSEPTIIKLTLKNPIMENGTYKVNYTPDSSKFVKDANDNKLQDFDTSKTNTDFTVDRTAPKVSSAEIQNDSKNKITLTFDKDVKKTTSGGLKDLFKVTKGSNNLEISNATITTDKKKVEITLSEEATFGELYKVSYTGNETNYIESELNTKIENFSDLAVKNKVKLGENQTIEADNYMFKGLSDGTVTLTGKKTSVSRAQSSSSAHIGTIRDGVVSVGGSTVNVTQIGDGKEALTGDNFNVAELNNIIPNVTKIEAKAFDGKTLEGATRISFPKVTEVKDNGLGIKAGCETIELPAVDKSKVNNIATNALKGSGQEATNSIKNIEVKDDAVQDLKKKITDVNVSKVVAPPTAEKTIDVGSLQFTIVTPATVDTTGTVKLTNITGTASNSNSGIQSAKLSNGVLSGTIDTKTFKYNFTEIATPENVALDSTKFAELVNDNNLSKVTTIGEKAFSGSTLPTEVTFPAVTTIKKEAFKNVKGIETLVLPVITNMDNQAFGIDSSNTSVKTLKTTANTGYFLINHINNKGVKIKSIETPSATTDAANVTGKTNSSVSTDITINISNEFLKTTINANTDVSSWISNLPAGLKATVKDAKTSQKITLTIAGTPTQEKSETINIKIPADVLSFGDAIQVDSKAKFEITKATSSNSGGGSSSGSYSQSGSVSLGNKDKTVTSENTSEGTTAENKNKTTTDTNIEFKDLKIDEINLPTITGSAANFSDVPATHWASESIGKLSSAGIIKGVPGGGFNANGNSKRADVAIMLTRLLGLENKTSTARFSDVSPNAYYANAVGVARQYGIINGNADGTFNPESYISRQDTMVMISRILDNLNVSTNADTTVLAQFSDTANISSYALEATSKLVNLGIINGNEGKINPKHAITRAEMAVIMDRVYGIIDKKVKEEAAKETTTESTSTTETTTSKDGSTTTTESTSTTETTTSKQ